MGNLSRPGAAGLCLVACLASTAPRATADDVSAAEPVVRVLLIESSGPVRLRNGQGVTELKSNPDGLLADSRAVGKRFRLRGQEPLRAGDLRVRGSLVVRWKPGGLSVVNRVGLEDYVAGTLGREIYPQWHAETLKAQAVVVRTYALHHMARRVDRAYDMERGTSHQVYGGYDAETNSVVSAATATRGQFLSYRREPILAAYHSASGGRTASAEEVWGRLRRRVRQGHCRRGR